MSKGEAGEPKPRDPKALMSAGGLLAAVAAVFVLGAVLHGEVPAPEHPPADRPARAAVPALPPEPVDVPAPEPELPQGREDGLDGRSRRDLARLSDDPGAWTLQLVVACKEEGVQGLVDRAGGDARLFVLPKQVNGRACWAVTWGTFASEAAAAAAAPPRNLPLGEAPRPRPVTAFAP